jgi:hypothetical protein
MPHANHASVPNLTPPERDWVRLVAITDIAKHLSLDDLSFLVSALTGLVEVTAIPSQIDLTKQ